MYPNEPTIHESISQFFTFYENYSTREDVEEDMALGNMDEDHPYFKDVEAFEAVKNFIEEVYEIAFGDDAINRDYDPDEVIERLHNFSDRSLVLEDNAFDKDQIKLIKHVFNDYVAVHPNEEMVSKKEMEAIFKQLDGLDEADYEDL